MERAHPKTKIHTENSQVIRRIFERAVYAPMDDVLKEKEFEKPIYWVSKDSVTEEVWDKVFDIYKTEFVNGHAVNKPNFEDITKLSFGGERLLEYRLTRRLNHVLEVRTLISGNELFLRFKAYSSGLYDDSLGEKSGKDFEKKVDELLLSRNIAVPLSEIC